MDKEKVKKIINDPETVFHGEIIWMENTDSTNNQAKEFAVHGKECLIVAGSQSKGRGRYDRTFASDEGGLYMSLCLRLCKEKIDKFARDAKDDDKGVFALGERLLKYPIKAGEAVLKALEEIYGAKFEIKLPNDILLNKKKVCGILLESVPHDDDFYIIFGVGINLNNELPADLDNADSICNLTGIKAEHELVCAAVVRAIIGIL